MYEISDVIDHVCNHLLYFIPKDITHIINEYIDSLPFNKYKIRYSATDIVERKGFITFGYVCINEGTNINISACILGGMCTILRGNTSNSQNNNMSLREEHYKQYTMYPDKSTLDMFNKTSGGNDRVFNKTSGGNDRVFIKNRSYY
jgi:hypothetical protein